MLKTLYIENLRRASTRAHPSMNYRLAIRRQQRNSIHWPRMLGAAGLFGTQCKGNDDLRCGFSDGVQGCFQRFDRAVVKLDVVAGGRIRVEPNGAGDDERNRFCLCFLDGLAGYKALIIPVKCLMREFVNQHGEFRSGEFRAYSDFASRRTSFRVAQID